MSQKTITLIVALFALIVLGMFVYASMKRAEIVEVPVDVAAEESDEIAYPSIQRIDATHYYIDGTHTLVGEILFPTPCDLLETSATVAESYPEQITINFEVINNSEMCTQVVNAQRFKVSADASSEATFSAQFMGRQIPLNLKPAPEGETPEDFEVFIKG